MKKHFAIAILLILVFAVSISTVLAETPITQSFDTIGSIVAFGRYEQDGNKENGPEEIEWIVLDVKDRRSLLISRYALDTVPYHTEDINITWEKCTLRTWLNGSFPRAFIMTANRDPLAGPPAQKALAQRLAELNVPFVDRTYGDDAMPLDHVFHCDVRSSAARLCNDDECRFFLSAQPGAQRRP